MRRSLYRWCPKSDATVETQSGTPSESLSEWLKENLTNGFTNAQDSTEDVFSQALLNAFIGGSGYLRLFIKDEYPESQRLKRLGIHAPNYGQVFMRYTQNGLLNHIDYVMSNDKVERQVLDFKTGLTTFYLGSSIDELDKGKYLETPFTLDLNYGFTIVEVKMKPLTTPAIRGLQNGLNMVLTMMTRCTEQAGFLERILLNAQTPGTWVEDTVTGDDIFIPSSSPMYTGAGSVNYVNGIPTSKANGDEDYTNPEVVFREPVDTKTFIDTANYFVKLIYNSLNQGHILAVDDGNISGSSRIQLKEDFKKSIERIANKLQNSLTCLS